MALGSALEAVRPGGKVAVVGLYADEMRFSPTPAVRRELSLFFSYSCNYADYQTALELLGSGAIDPGPRSRSIRSRAPPWLSRPLGRGQGVKADPRPLRVEKGRSDEHPSRGWD